MLDPACLNLAGVSAEGEAMAHWHFDSTEISGSSEAERWNAFITVIVHQNASDCMDCQLVLIRCVGVHVVKRIGIFGVTV